MSKEEDGAPSYYGKLWTEEEDEKYLSLLELHGRDYAKIAQDLKNGRTEAACSMRAAKLVKYMHAGKIKYNPRLFCALKKPKMRRY